MALSRAGGVSQLSPAAVIAVRSRLSDKHRDCRQRQSSRATGDRIYERVHAPKLMGMLGGKGLARFQTEEILATLDQRREGYQTTIAFNDHKP